jgi:predicted ATPase/DNA-binding CsgD family transcriptional regulator/Tfp pilus assembly protein PilF
MTTDTGIGAGNLPAEPNSFVGRERDLAELALMLGEVRALTLCGPGGIGKTRLALRLAFDLVPDYSGGAWLVELGDTDDPELVPLRVAAALGIREEPGRPLADTLTDALRSRRLVLILDTCEHVVEACAALAHQLLAGCPELRLIATSREPLRVRGETAWRVPPLALPAPFGELSDADLAEHEAIRLFAERAAAVRPGFTLNTTNIGAVVRLCRTLDGIPLAIELAAARIRALSVEQIAGRLSDRFQLLAGGDRTAPPRQQTLRAAVDWSYELLTGPEQVLLRRLSVFSDWNLDMAERICAGQEIPAGAVLGLLAALIDKSLVTLDAELDGTARYRLLDTIREYAASRLTASGEGTAVRVLHRDYLLDLVEHAAAVAFVRGDPPWPVRVTLYQRIHAERANFIAALAVSYELGHTQEGLRLCCALRSPWITNGDASQGAVWCDRFLALAEKVLPGNGPAGKVPDVLRARALITRAELAFEQEDYPAAAASARAGLELCPRAGLRGTAALRLLAVISMRSGDLAAAMDGAAEALAAARADGDHWEEGLAHATRAVLLARQRDLAGAQGAYETALEVLRDNNGWGVALALYGLGWLARSREDYPGALRCFGEALVLYRQIDARPEIARTLAGVGWVALTLGDLDLARSSLTESAQLSLATGQRLQMARIMTALGVLALAERDPERAIRMQGAAQALRAEIGRVHPRPGRDRVAVLFDAARQQLGGTAGDRLLAEGRAMGRGEAIRHGTSPAGSAAPGTSVPAATVPGITVPGASAAGAGQAATAPSSLLTPRELEIATLVTRGLSNQAIADELVISRATAARHVANIFTKLGFTSRAQLAAWTAGRD